MTSTLLDLYTSPGGISGEQDSGEPLPFSYLPDRKASFEKVSGGMKIDLLVVGGGVTGAITAHLGAMNGLRVVLVCSGDYNRSSGDWISYLAGAEEFDGRRGLAALRDLYRAGARMSEYCPRAVRHETIRGPLFESFFGTLGAPFTVPAGKVRTALGLLRGRGASYPIVDDALLVNEAVLGARQEGAVCLNHTELAFLEPHPDNGTYRAGITDELTQRTIELDAGSVAFCAPGYPIPGTRLAPRSKRDTTPSKFMTYTGIFAGSMRRGTRFRIAESEVERGLALPIDAERMMISVSRIPATRAVCEAVESEAIEALAQLGIDVGPRISSRLTNARAGTASRPLMQRGGVLVATDGAPWRAMETAVQIVRKVLTAAPSTHPDFVPLDKLVTPGDVMREGRLARFETAARGVGLSDRDIARCIARWGSKVVHLTSYPDGLDRVSRSVLRGEIRLALAAEQVCRLSDLLFRVLRIDNEAGWRDEIPAIADAFAAAAETQLPDGDVRAAFESRLS